MSLPKTTQPLFPITVPSTKEKKQFRRFLVKEEKILLMAKQSDDKVDKLRAVEQVITNCAADPIVIDSLTTFDFDYIFLKLRAASVDNMIRQSYIDQEDEKQYDFDINLDTIEIDIPKKLPIIEVNDSVKIKMVYPTMKQMLKISTEIAETSKDKDDQEQVEAAFTFSDHLIKAAIGEIYDSETIYDGFSNEELTEWIDQLDIAVYDKMRDFLGSIPDLTHTIKYKNSKGTDREIVLRGIEDFFTLG